MYLAQDSQHRPVVLKILNSHKMTMNARGIRSGTVQHFDVSNGIVWFRSSLTATSTIRSPLKGLNCKRVSVVGTADRSGILAADTVGLQGSPQMSGFLKKDVKRNRFL